MRRLKTNLLLKTIAAIYFFCPFFFLSSCNENKHDERNTLDINDFKPLAKIHVKLCSYLEDDSLDWHEEKEQSYANYCAQLMVCPNDTINKIYILPLGSFNTLEMKLIKNTAEYISLFFMLETKVLEPVSDSIVSETARRINFGKEQLKTQYIFDSILKLRFPKDAICYMAITNIDLYPNENYNFVFGQANLFQRVDVSSYNRFIDNNLDNSNYDRCYEQIINTATHELGHMFSLKHCTSYECLLNQIDKRPYWLCPECLAKLQWRIKFNVLKRYDKLIKYSEEHHFINEAKFYKLSKEIMSTSLRTK